jgi:alkylglycerol monooxygenase
MRDSLLVIVCWIALVLAFFEACFAEKRRIQIYTKSQTEVAIGLAIGNLFVTLTALAFLQQLFHIPEANKPLAIPHHAFGYVLAFFALDFLAYFGHWLSHKIPLFWADHAVHHANTEFNFVTHIAHGWTMFVSAALLISFITGLYANAQTVIWVYFLTATAVQTLAHTQLVHKLGILEHFLVTPSHHRVHHAVERAKHDHNYGLLFIVWDKLFRTFQAEGSTQITEFGLPHSPKLAAPLWTHAFYYWRDYFKNWSYPIAKRQ